MTSQTSLFALKDNLLVDRQRVGLLEWFVRFDVWCCPHLPAGLHRGRLGLQQRPVTTPM